MIKCANQNGFRSNCSTDTDGIFILHNINKTTAREITIPAYHCTPTKNIWHSSIK